jgi:50S ribosomal protein L16 3-hydroxylase
MPLQLLNTPTPLLGGLSPQDFCARIWHQRPQLIRGALPVFTALLSRKQLFDLARKSEVESRLITAFDKRWQLKHGPFSTLPARSKPGWTLLVQGVDLHHDAAHALLERFTFIQRARLDDLMISYASRSGGVGPHVDSYDVFLLQAAGRRRWRISTQQDLTLVPGLPLKILKNFKPTEEWVLEPGDMLYLPPNIAHEGVALDDDCMTYSIGFRAPAKQALFSALLDDVQEVLQVQGHLNNAQARAANAQHSARLPQDALDQLAALVRQQWPSRQTLTDFLGRALTEPKTEAVFDAPTRGGFKQGLALARASRALYAPGWFFINGESWKMGGDDAKLLTRLATQRYLDSSQLQTASPALLRLLREWKEMGWITTTCPRPAPLA